MWQRRLKRLAYCIAVSGALLLLFRNPAAKFVGEQVGSYLLENKVVIGRVRIGFSEICVEHFQVLESRLGQQPLLRVNIVRLRPTIWRGLRTGVWAKSLQVQAPHVFLRFDVAGKLLSHFPSFEATEKPPTESPFVFPAEYIQIKSASLTVAQDEKQPFSVSAIDLEVLAGERLQATLNVGNFLDTSIHIHSDIDSANFEGETSFTLLPLKLESHKLSKLPFASPELADLRFSGTLSACGRIKHPESSLDWREHEAALCVDATELQGDPDHRENLAPQSIEAITSRFLEAKLGNHVSLLLQHRAGNIQFRCQGRLAGGKISAAATADLSAGEIPSITGNLQVTSVNCRDIVAIAVPNAPVSALLNVQGQFSSVPLPNNTLHLKGSVKPILSRVELDGLAFADIHTSVGCDAQLQLSPSLAVSGRLLGETDSAGLDLTQLSQRFGLPTLTGKAGFHANLEIPLATAADTSSYKAKASLGTSRITIDGIHIRPVIAVVALKNGCVSAHAHDLELAVLPVSERPTACLIDKAMLGEATRLRVDFVAASTIEQATSPAGWNATCQVRTENFALATEPISDVHAVASLQAGKIQLAPLLVQWREMQAHLSGTGRIDAEPLFELQFNASNINLFHIGQVASQFSPQPLLLTGEANANGSAHINLATTHFTASGAVQLNKATAQNRQIGDLEMRWTADRNLATLRTESENFLGGRVALHADLASLDWTTAKIGIAWQSIAIKRLIDLAKVAIPVPDGLTASGSLDGRLDVEQIASLKSLSVSGVLASRSASIQGIPIAFKTRELRVEDGHVRVAGGVDLLGGQASLEATTQIAQLLDWLDKSSPVQHIPVTARLAASGLNVQPALLATIRNDQMRLIDAVFGATITRDSNTIQQGLLCTADFTLDRVRYNNTMLADRLRASTLLHPHQMQVRKLDGRIAGGQLQGEADVTFAQALDGRYRVSVEHASLRRAFAPISSLANISGTASIAAAGKIGSLTTASVRVAASNIYAGQIAVRELRMPLTCDYQLAAGRAQWRCRGGTVRVGGGLVQIDSEGDFSRGLASFTTDINAAQVDTSKLLRGNSVNAGIANANVTLRAKLANSAEDIVGKFHVELSQIQSLALPGFDQLLQFTKMPSLSGPTLGENDLGIIDGRIGGGLVYIDDATLSKSGLLILMDGTSTLQGRLNMNVTAITNPSGPADGLMDFANSPLMMAGPAPIALLAKANDALKDRVIYVHVSGTAGRPTLHIQPGKGLSQDAIRFVLSSTIGSQAANMAVKRPSNKER